MGNLDGKVALVTGAARGQGRAHAVTLARSGAHIVALDVPAPISSAPYPMATPDDLAETVRLVQAEGSRAVSCKADVRSQEQLDIAVSRGLQEFGHIDILIANAGIWSVAPFWEITEKQWGEMIDINLGGVWRSVKALAPHMIERAAGSVVVTSSVNGFEAGANWAHYVAAKHGVIGLMRNMALELAPYGIRCNAICPGPVDTAMVNWQGAYDLFAGKPGGTREDLLGGARSFNALKGLGALNPQTLADVALWLVSDSASAITGVALPVDGGHMLMPGVNPEP